ncbi:MAG TPA: TorF family putative porin [Brevundimonas sp.]|jgi:uncharacterized protein (TIGR02001 family)
MRYVVRAALAGVLILSGAPALAQSADGAWTLEARAGVVSDYRWRGTSLSGGDPALQAGATLSHANGLYGDVYVSSIEEYGFGVDGDGAEIEVTLTAGWAGAVAGFDVDAGVAAYQYPDGSDVAYVEIPVQAGRTVGPWTWTLGAAFAPAQSALGDEDNRYVWVGAVLAPEAWPVALEATVGREEGAWAPDGKTDWSLGARAPFGPVEIGLAWVDSNVDEGAAVASLFASF